jgi:sigma-B regulation protein RsbU (phosphoserine phosphatase)
MPMKSRGSSGLYWLLFLYIAVSTAYVVVCQGINLHRLYFTSERFARIPFAIDGVILKPHAAAKKAGLAKGDILIALNGAPYRGRSQLVKIQYQVHTGDSLLVQFRKSDGSLRTVSLRLDEPLHRNAPPIVWILNLVLATLPCALSLLVGYWVVAARPRDRNAWLILLLLSCPAVFLSHYDMTTGAWRAIFCFWYESIWVLGPVALLLFGLYFPGRWRLDRKLPWLKWLLIAPPLAAWVPSLILRYSEDFAAGSISWYSLGWQWIGRIINPVSLACVFVFLVAAVDKLWSSPARDTRRRMRILSAGTVLGLGSYLLVFMFKPGFMHVENLLWLRALAVLLFILCPLSLAYVVVAQRAMDLRILLRLGTRYMFAKATLLALELGLVTLLAVRLVVPVISKGKPQFSDLLWLALLAAAAAVVARYRLDLKLRTWLDRQFFREAYNTELVLNELSEQVRKFTDTDLLLQTVCRRIAEVLHVAPIAVLLRGENCFRLQQAVGFDCGMPLLLPESSAAVQNLLHTGRPATLYRESPEAWFLQSNAAEQTVLNSLQTELLLSLPGRERLMGVVTLGPKRSEEPYTPSDLHLLSVVAAQTGMALEVSELARSLAAEAAQRERANRELEIAREVQERLFPQAIPAVPGITLTGACRPALGVGGDYYDVMQFPTGRLGLAIGDVSGKGISAALLMASLRASLRGMTMDTPEDLAKLMQNINRLVYEASSSNRYATFFFAEYDPASRALRYVNAGHNPPLLLRAKSDSCPETFRLDTGGPVVGLIPQSSYAEQQILLQPGDLLLCYTDGISEAMTAADEEWGEARMLDVAWQFHTCCAPDILRAIFDAADKFTAGAPQHDDMTLLVLKLNPV